MKEWSTGNGRKNTKNSLFRFSCLFSFWGRVSHNSCLGLCRWEWSRTPTPFVYSSWVELARSRQEYQFELRSSMKWRPGRWEEPETTQARALRMKGTQSLEAKQTQGVQSWTKGRELNQARKQEKRGPGMHHRKESGVQHLVSPLGGLTILIQSWGGHWRWLPPSLAEQ